MNQKPTEEEAKAVAKIIKDRLKFATPDKPDWFVNATPYMTQDGSFSVDVCVIDLALVPDEIKERFLFKTLKDVMVHMRVVKPAPKYKWQDTE
jgi:hypothetical protein